MAVIIWKDGESRRVEPSALESHLANGYTLEKEKPKKKKKEEKEDKREEQNDLSFGE